MLRSRLLSGSIVGRVRVGANWVWCKRGLCEDSSASQRSGDTQGYAPMPTGREADPAMHASEPQAEVADGPTPQRTVEDDLDPLVPPKLPISSSPKLEHTAVGLPSKPNYQRQEFSTRQAQPSPDEITDIGCSGLDGSPWPDDAEGQKAQKKAQEEDNKEYFKDHKASPLSEIEFADSRKPISQATDSSPGPARLILFTEEQQDSAEEALMRAAEIWRWNKMRGDPDSPHGKVLRELRGEYW